MLRRLVEDRDRGCRVPACTQVRWVEVHHLLHVEDGGETVPENLACLCPRHHHEPTTAGSASRATLRDPTRLCFTDRGGKRIEPPAPTLPERPPPDAARHLGVDAHLWEPPSGEHLDARWFAWSPSAA